MSNHKLTYYHRLSKGSINYGPLTMKVTTEKQVEASVETYEFCHNTNTSKTEFSMTQEVSVSGVIKMFDVGASHSQTFAIASEKSTVQGKEIKNFQKEFVGHKVEITRTIKDDQFLAYYVVVDLLCFTVDGGKRQYAHVPRSDVIVEPMDGEEMAKLSKGSFLMEKASWEIVSARYPDIELDDIPAQARQLTPLALKAEDVRVMDDFPGMGKVAIRSISSGCYLDGRDKTGDKVYILNKPSANFTQWRIERVFNYYAIRSVSSNCCLDGRDSSYVNQAGAILVSGNNPLTHGQHLLWEIERVDGHYALRSVASNCYLDGREFGYHGKEPLLTNRKPQGDRYLQWTITSV